MKKDKLTAEALAAIHSAMGSLILWHEQEYGSVPIPETCATDHSSPGAVLRRCLLHLSATKLVVSGCEEWIQVLEVNGLPPLSETPAPVPNKSAKCSNR